MTPLESLVASLTCLLMAGASVVAGVVCVVALVTVRAKR
jgi:hypothetical protein